VSVERVPMTPNGHKKLQAELHRLKTVERPEVINGYKPLTGAIADKENEENRQRGQNRHCNRHCIKTRRPKIFHGDRRPQLGRFA